MVNWEVQTIFVGGNFHGTAEIIWIKGQLNPRGKQVVSRTVAITIFNMAYSSEDDVVV